MDKKMMKKNLFIFYITHQDNLPSILQRGILSHHKAEDIPDSNRIYDESIVSRRKERITPDGKSLWDFANFYFNPRNPMMYRVYCCENKDVVVLRINLSVFNDAKYVSVGNAAVNISEIYDVKTGIAKIQTPEIWKMLNADSWGAGEGKRLIMSELLVPERVSPNKIETVYARNMENADKIKEKIKGARHVVPEPNLFFGNNRVHNLSGTNITLIDGDMFFSKMQTLTISVNTVGVMGAGLASRAKENFPSLYVKFQETCRNKKLSTKTPYLYKENYSYDEHMADEPNTLTEKPNDEKWFLLFATKEHWRYPSKMEYIGNGLQWLVENAKKDNIRSLALPALGCGLGGLPWHTVGPKMCQYLHKLEIPCEIYLPREANIPDDQLSKEFLLGL